MRIIYLGTPDFAVQAMNEINNSHHEIVAVVTQPDRIGNRNKIVMPSVKTAALGLNLPVLQYNKISRDGVDELRSYGADIMVTCAYGQILSDEVLSICPKGVINIHASMLPKYRGSCPINKAIIDGESVTGITIMQTVKAVDAGDIIMSEEVQILPNETAGELFDRLSEVGARLIVRALNDIEQGLAVYTPQDSELATYCRMINKSDGIISFDLSARQIHDFVRGMTPWPAAQILINGVHHKVLSTEILDLQGERGVVIAADSKNGIIIGTSDKAIKIAVIQAAGGKAMSSESYMLGHNIEVGSVVGE